MPRGLVRRQQTGDFHYVTFSCFHRRPYLAAPETRDLMERSLETMRIRYNFVVCGYVLMPNHVHLLLSEPKISTLSDALKALKLSVAVQREERPFWQRRYYDFNVFTSNKRTEKLRYMHRNPVKRGLVDDPAQWPWSSFRHYATGERGTVEIESEWLAAWRDRAAPKAHISEARCGAPLLKDKRRGMRGLPQGCGPPRPTRRLRRRLPLIQSHLKLRVREKSIPIPVVNDGCGTNRFILGQPPVRVPHISILRCGF